MDNFLTKDKVKTIIENAPKGISPEDIVNGLVSRGYKLEGFNDKPEKPKDMTGAEKVASFTGGKQIAQGLGQAIAQKEISTGIEDTLQKQIKIQGDLVSTIKTLKEQGKDTSRFENALDLINQDIKTTTGSVEELLNPNELTAKSVIGDALQLGTTIAGVGSYSKAGLTGEKALTTGLQKTIPTVASEATKAVGVGQGIIQGAKTGAISGGIYGASSGVSEALKEDKLLGETISSGITGAIGSGITGGILGGIVGGISGGIKGKSIRQEKNTLDAITPNTKNLSKIEYQKLLDQKRIAPKTGTKGSQYILSKTEKQTALKYPNLLTSKDPVKNYTSIVDEISKQDEQVGEFLRSNNGIFNNGELKNSLNNKLKDITDISIDEKVIGKNKQKLVNNFIKNLDKNDMESLWKARKEFDREIEKSFTGSPSLQNKIKREFRNAVQEFIAERTPDKVYKNSMKEMSNLFKLKDLVGNKALTEKGQSGIRLWMKNNPVKTKVIGIGAPSLVGGALLLD